MKIITDYPGISRTQIYKLDGRTYRWLLRNDKEWLSVNNVPIKKSNSPIKYENYWTNKENELITQLPNVLERLRSLPGKPRQITKTAIEKEYDHVSFTPEFILHTPKFAKLLEMVIETRIEYGLRIKNWINQKISILPTFRPHNGTR
jgi:hypothetical protein